MKKPQPLQSPKTKPTPPPEDSHINNVEAHIFFVEVSLDKKKDLIMGTSVEKEHPGTDMEDVFRLMANSLQNRKVILAPKRLRLRAHQAGRASAAVMAVRVCRLVTA